MNEAVQTLLEDMRNQHRGKAFEQICHMGWEDLEPVKIRRKTYYPAVWSQDHGDDEVLLVVQLTKWQVPKIIGTTDCIGLIKNRMNRTIDVDALWLMHHIGYP